MERKSSPPPRTSSLASTWRRLRGGADRGPALEDLPCIPLAASRVETLPGPTEFRKTLLDLIARARERILIATLYLQDDEAGREVLSALHAAKAGEVVERPASAVKELMENAIDAGSSEVIIELKMAGLQLIRLIDNGEGIDREEVPQAFQRYATSKIEKEDDLFAIRTLGFRGEALPSIISVSQTVRKRRTAGAVGGTKGVCEGGEVKGVTETGCPVGTDLEVRNLFYNLPVKRKFLKSIRSELRGCLHPFLRLSLSYPEISFQLIHDGRLLYEYPRTESHSVRVEAILGKEVFDHLRPIAYEEAGIRLSGFASLPSFSNGNSDGIYLYVNQRYVKDRMVHKAIMEAYRHVIPANRYPVVVLFSVCCLQEVDDEIHSMLFLAGKFILFVFNEASGANRHWSEFLAIEAAVTAGGNLDFIAAQYMYQLARDPPAQAGIDSDGGNCQDVDFGRTDSEG